MSHRLTLLLVGLMLLLPGSALSLAATPRHVPSASTSRSARTLLQARVPTPGGYYRVVVTVRRHGPRASVRVSVAGQAARWKSVAAGSAERVTYPRVLLTHRRLSVLAVSSAPAARLKVTLTPDTPAPVTPSSAAVAAPAPAPAPVPAPAPAPAPLVPLGPLAWSDEFSGSAGSAPDPSKWSFDQGGSCGGSTPYTNTQNTANASLDGAGHLVITALDSGGSYTSAQLDTAAHFSMQYGTVEASMQLPAGAGLCSAFWMVGDGTPSPSSPCWPQCGEIDILEALSQLPTTAIFTAHGPTTDGSSSYQQYEATASGLPDLTAGFHTYGLTWTPDSLTWTVDGVAYATETKAALIAANGPNAWVFDAPFHIILDLAVGNWQEGPNPNTPFPAKLAVDWVRVYGQ